MLRGNVSFCGAIIQAKNLDRANLRQEPENGFFNRIGSDGSLALTRK